MFLKSRATSYPPFCTQITTPPTVVCQEKQSAQKFNAEENTAEEDKNSTTIDISNYDVLDGLGYGSFATVFKARDRKSQQLVAIKRINNETVAAEPEIDIMERVSLLRNTNACEAANLIAYYGQFLVHSQQFIVTEFVEGLDMFEWTKSLYMDGQLEKTLYIGSQLLHRLAKKLFGALALLHRNSIYHMDIKPENIMIRNHTYEPVLIDFGVSCHAQDLPSLHCSKPKIVGTVPYIHPKFIERRHEHCSDSLRRQTDVWAMGLSLLYAVGMDSLIFDIDFDCNDWDYIASCLNCTQYRLPTHILLDENPVATVIRSALDPFASFSAAEAVEILA